MGISRTSKVLLGALLALGLPGVGLASGDAPKAQDRAAALQAVLDCRGLSEASARLACYDEAALRMSQAEARGDIVVIDRAQAKAAHRAAFGLAIQSLDFLTRGMGSEDIDKLEGRVSTARQDPTGKWVIRLEDGALWHEISGDLSRWPKPGSKVVIHKGSLGSYLMSVDGQATIKVHREN